MSLGACRSQWDPVALSIKGNLPIWEHAHEYIETNQIPDIIARRCGRNSSCSLCNGLKISQTYLVP